VPAEIVACFRGNILNVHPSLLPKYGGSGMFGLIVHQQVVKNRELFSGSTVHIVDEVFDNGDIIGQTRVELAPDETPETLEEKNKKQEREFYPLVVNRFAERLLSG
jgi:phosphoribosylglycinamide formyltransferase-1